MVGQFLQPVGSAAQDEDFQTVVAVEMDVGRRGYLSVMVVLHFHQPAREVGLAVVIDECQHADGRAPAGLKLVAGKLQPNKVADCLGAIRAGAAEQSVEPLQQVRFHRNAEPYRARIFVVVLSVTHLKIVTRSSPRSSRAAMIDSRPARSYPQPPMNPLRPIGLIVLFVLAAAAHGKDVTWDSVVRLTTNSAGQCTGYSGQHSVAADAAGNVHVAWLDQRTVPYKVWYRRYDAGTRTWQPETMLTSRPANCFRPGIACDSAGNVSVVWHFESWQGPGIWYKRFDAALRRWKADTLIDSASTSQPQQYPSVSCVPGSGDVEVVWYGAPDTGGVPQVFLKERHRSSGWDSAMQVSTAPVVHDQVSVAAGKNGDVVVVWCGTDFGSMHNQVLCRRRVAGAWQEVELVSDIPGDLAQYSPGVAFDRNGAVHVVWHGMSGLNFYQQVFHRERDAVGWSSIDSISGVRAYQQQFPSIACDAAGRCHVVWCSQGGTEHMQLAYGQRDTDGVWSSPMVLTGLDSGDVSCPSVTCEADSGIHIVWYDASSGNQDVYYLHGVTPGPGVEEGRKPPDAMRFTPNATIVHERLVILQPANCNLQTEIVLLDASGRRAASLFPGPNDVRSLPAGVYFVVSQPAAKPSVVIILH